MNTMLMLGNHGRIVLALLILGGFLIQPALAWRGDRPYPTPENSLPPVIGNLLQVQLKASDTLMELARRNEIGFSNLKKANPHVDPWHPLPDQKVSVPLATIPPTALSSGITINLAEMRLYKVEPGEKEPRLQIFPIGIGRTGLETPEGRYTVVTRIENPVWKVPKRILAEEPDHPRWVKPGPDNPLGHRWLGLSATGYGIHGTNRPYGIGRRVSGGCIRLYPTDIDTLFNQTDLGTTVRIIYQPIKLGRRGTQLFLEAHPDFEGRDSVPREQITRAAGTLAPGAVLDWNRIEQALKERAGIPVPIGDLPQIPVTTTVFKVKGSSG